jgi:hypothetical protein
MENFGAGGRVAAAAAWKAAFRDWGTQIANNLRVCLKTQFRAEALGMESRLQAVWAQGRLKAGLQTRIFKRVLRTYHCDRDGDGE